MGSQKYYPRLKYYAQSFLTGQLGPNQNKIKTLYCNDERVKLAARQCTPYEMGVVARYVNITIFPCKKQSEYVHQNHHKKSAIVSFCIMRRQLIEKPGIQCDHESGRIQPPPCTYFTAGPVAHLSNISNYSTHKMWPICPPLPIYHLL